jgi:hypothetical protein
MLSRVSNLVQRAPGGHRYKLRISEIALPIPGIGLPIPGSGDLVCATARGWPYCAELTVIGAGPAGRVPAGGRRGSEPDMPDTAAFATMRAVMRASERHREGGVDPELQDADADPGPDT